MNPGDNLPREGHIARLCKGSQVEDDVVDAAAFELRIDDGETELSVNWLEFFGYPDHVSAIEQLQQIFHNKMTVRQSFRFARLNIGEVLDHVQVETSGRTLRIVYDPDEQDNDLSHSLICDAVENNREIAALIAQKIIEVYPAKAD